MVRGLGLFRDAFQGFADQYVLIGGTAASLSLGQAGLPFRATKDLDIVLLVEALTPAFGAAFWSFVRDGGYQARLSASTGKPCFYRFDKPKDLRYPAMIELFSRVPEALRGLELGHLSPLPLGDDLSSLSAILLDDSYYAFVIEGRREVDGLSWVGEDRLIPLKATAWLELRAARARGEAVDSAVIRKHANDILRLAQLLSADVRVQLSGRILVDMRRFVAALAEDPSVQPQALGLQSDIDTTLRRIAVAFGL
jgi:hypothetical protein